MSGWIKIHREITDHWIFQDAEKFKWWIDLLMIASHEDVKKIVGSQLIELKRGQLIASNSFLSERWKTSESSVRRYLGLLESDNMVVRCTNRKITIITICNYERYQVNETKERTDERSDDEPMMNRWRSEYKNVEEDKEIYIDLTNAPASRTREENPAWDEARESGFVERFKAQGSARLIMRVTGKSPEDVMRLLDAYLASRQMKDLGHKDFNHFLEAFQHAIKNNKISIPVAPAQPKEKKVISGADIFKVYGE